MALQGKRVALAEGRQLEELATMLAKEGAEPMRCPLLSILDAPDPAPIRAWLDQLEAGEFDLVIFFTGEGVRRLRGFAERDGREESYRAALTRVPILTRGPKPVQALREMGLSPWKVAESPTTDGVIATLRKEGELQNKRISIQLYSPENALLTEFLRDAGAVISTVLPYVYAPSADADRVADLIARMAAGEVDAVVFTSSPQVERMYDVATERGTLDALESGLRRVCVASVGPIVGATLESHNIPITVQPEQGFVMKNLVQHIKRHFDRG